jgi:hypothetical protein
MPVRVAPGYYEIYKLITHHGLMLRSRKRKISLVLGLNYETKDYIHKSLGHVFTQKIISSDLWI